MLRFALATVLSLYCGAAFAGPMPKLPADMPPLPTDYLSAGGWSGPYAGLLAGVISEDEMRPELATIAGFNFEADALVGIEAQLAASANDAVSLAGLGRLGIISDDTWGLYGLAGIGFESDDGAFATLGGGLELALADTWHGRIEYQHAVDLSARSGRDAVRVGLTYGY